MSIRPQHHIGGDPGAREPAAPFGDIRDLIEALPEHAGGTGYRTSDIFPEKHRWLRENVPDATSVFEFGALCGYFLVTALDACPISRVGWVDNELHTPGSNEMTRRNVRWVCEVQDRDLGLDGDVHLGSDFFFGPRTLIEGGAFREPWDVVQVDGEHTYRGCLIDLTLALAMRPKAILVDDSHAIQEVAEAIRDFCDYLGLEAEWFETVNGFAVIRP